MSSDVPALVVEDMRKRFGALEVLKGVSLTANEGDVISILGASGSGKSTFLRCINLLETPDEGVGHGRRRDAADAHARRRPARGRRPAPARAHPLRTRHGVPELQSVVAHDDARKPDRGADPCAEAAARRGVEEARALLDKVGIGRQGGPSIPRICRAASSSASRSRARWRCGRR